MLRQTFPTIWNCDAGGPGVSPSFRNNKYFSVHCSRRLTRSKFPDSAMHFAGSQQSGRHDAFYILQTKLEIEWQIYIDILRCTYKPLTDHVAAGRPYSFQQYSKSAQKAKKTQA